MALPYSSWLAGTHLRSYSSLIKDSTNAKSCTCVGHKGGEVAGSCRVPASPVLLRLSDLSPAHPQPLQYPAAPSVSHLLLLLEHVVLERALERLADAALEGTARRSRGRHLLVAALRRGLGGRRRLLLPTERLQAAARLAGREVFHVLRPHVRGHGTAVKGQLGKPVAR